MFLWCIENKDGVFLPNIFESYFVFQGSLTLPFPAPCLSLFLHPQGFHPQQTPAWPWQTLSGNSQHTLLVQTQAAARGGRQGLGQGMGQSNSQ